MHKIFEPARFCTVPDGTEVGPFMNAADPAQRDLPWAALGEVSIAAGRIGPGVSSWVHVHPVVTQVTYVLSGRLAVRMKDATSPTPYSLELRAGTAALTQPGTLLQLCNTSEEAVEVLYIVSPPYVLEMIDGKVVYDDAVLLARSWEELAAAGDPPVLGRPREAAARRAEALRRLSGGKASTSARGKGTAG